MTDSTQTKDGFTPDRIGEIVRWERRGPLPSAIVAMAPLVEELLAASGEVSRICGQTGGIGQVNYASLPAAMARRDAAELALRKAVQR